MTGPTDRFKNFLSTYEFHTNSIQFRIHSSIALEKWKNVQAFQLNQLVNGKFYFPYDRREVLLLQYDLWSRFLYEIENLCIEFSGNHERNATSQEDMDIILNLAKKTSEKYVSIMKEEHKNMFNEKFIDILIELQKLIEDYFIDQMNSFIGLSFTKLFSGIVGLLVEIMQYTLTEIHELDIIFCHNTKECETCSEVGACSPLMGDPFHNHSKTLNKVGANRKYFVTRDEVPFIIISELSEKIFKLYNKCLICERIRIYKKYFEFDEIFFKNYTDELINPELISRVDQMGIKINYKKSLTKSY